MINVGIWIFRNDKNSPSLNLFSNLMRGILYLYTVYKVDIIPQICILSILLKYFWFFWIIEYNYYVKVEIATFLRKILLKYFWNTFECFWIKIRGVKIKFIELKDEIFTTPRENFQLEFKKSQTKLSSDVWSTYSAFANTNGGIIILGIEEIVSKKEYKVVGVDNPEKVITEFWNCIHDKQKVSVNLLTNEDVQTFKVSGKTIIEINVPKAPYERRPVYINNNKSKTYIRADDGDRIADDAQFKYLIVDSQNDIDSELLQNYDIDDLNLETVDEYRNLLYKNTNNSKYLELSHEELLKNIGVLKKTDKILSRHID